MKISSEHSNATEMCIIIALIVSNENGAFAALTFILFQPSGKTDGLVKDVIGLDN